MYSSTLRFQDFLRLVYGQLLAQKRGFRSGTIWIFDFILVVDSKF